MQTPITRDKDGNLVISEALIEQLTLGKLQDDGARGLVIDDGRLHIDLVDVESLNIREDKVVSKAEAEAMIRAISDKVRRDDLDREIRAISVASQEKMDAFQSRIENLEADCGSLRGDLEDCREGVAHLEATLGADLDLKVNAEQRARRSAGPAPDLSGRLKR